MDKTFEMIVEPSQVISKETYFDLDRKVKNQNARKRSKIPMQYLCNMRVLNTKIRQSTEISDQNGGFGNICANIKIHICLCY